ncbi:hypothetical protein [Catellatospora sichuanensis]|uniref:hypothetical protein n=1 Tax=Catellatospora sichuanensis TaxID=1969805 RepID=UPI00118412C6|nr:hypothetical protein [Catellatospora sichuanensis]
MAITVSLLIGLFALTVGAYDAVAADRVGEQVVGSIVAVAGLALAIAGGKALKDGARFRERGYALVGFALGAFPGSAICLIQLGSFGYSPRALYWMAMALLPFTVAVSAWAKGARPGGRQSTVWATVVTTILAAALPWIGGAFRAVEGPETLQVQALLTVSGHRQDPKLGKIAVVNISVTVRNISSRRLVFVASSYTLRAVKRPLVSNVPDTADTDIIDDLGRHSWSARYEKPSSAPKLIEAGYLYEPGDYLEAGSENTQSFPALVPLKQYDTAEVDVSIATGFADRALLGESTGSDYPLLQSWHLENTGLINKLTMGEQQVEVQYSLHTDEYGPLFGYSVTTADAPAERTQPYGTYNPHTESTFGFGVGGASHEIALDTAAP